MDDAGYFNVGKRFYTPYCFRNVTFRPVTHFLSDDFPFVGHTKQNGASLSVLFIEPNIDDAENDE